MKSIVLNQGYVTIPMKIRRKFGIQKGTVLHFSEIDGEIRIIPITQEWIQSNVGFMNTKGKLLKALMKEKMRQR
ncbi:AbrB/MazE/SpoVT family DNA-binding domain-containing protein [bacterium]|nr:AbrB/MazE/SpoVT family DNA-binding domain-containing protein [bacterium]